MRQQKDEFGYLLFSKEEFEKENQSMSVSSKNQLLLQMIEHNDSVFHDLTKEEPFYDCVLQEEKKKKQRGNPTIEVDYSDIENAKNKEELLFFLPEREDLLFSQKVALIKCHLRSTIDAYDRLLIEARLQQPDMIHYLLECKKELEEKLEFISTYGEKQESVKIEKQIDFHLLYYKDQGENYFLNDLLDENIDQFDSYYTLIQSIQNQTYKNIKRFDHKLYNLYQVRNADQRIIFDFLDSSTVVLVYAFTKKVQNSKKYRLNLFQRAEDYNEFKNSFREAFHSEEKASILQSGLEDTETILELLKSRNKSLVKEVLHGRSY